MGTKSGVLGTGSPSYASVLKGTSSVGSSEARPNPPASCLAQGERQLKSYPAVVNRDGKDGDGAWWRSTVVYEVYVRSFRDSTGNGIGDLKGLTSKLDYFSDLGVRTLWLSPFNPSPMVDFGYDVSNYEDVEPLFGDLGDFKSLIGAMKARDLKLIMDLVPNHTSDQHPWFVKSVKKEGPYKDYYVWRGRNSEEDPLPPNNWVSVFGGSMWEWSPVRGEFYLHQFAKEQPDLNYNNPAVVEELISVLKFWMGLGVDGFRLDALPHLFEDEKFRDEPPGPGHKYTQNLPKTLTVLEKFRAAVDAYGDLDGHPRVLMSEGYLDIKDVMAYYSQPSRKLAHFPFNFELITELQKGFTGHDVFRVVSSWMDNLPSKDSCPNWLIGNHDQPRVGTRFGPELVDAMNMIVLLLPGVAVSYYGEEIGMVNGDIGWEQTVDPWGVLAGKDKYKEHSRDPSRTPMQWNDTPHAGFSSAKASWLPVNPDYETLNVEVQLKAEESHLKVYKACVSLRKWEAFKYGGLELRVLCESAVFAFVRSVSDVKIPGIFVAVNFGDLAVDVDLTCFPSIRQPLTLVTRSVPNTGAKRSNPIKDAGKLHLLPKEGIVLSF